jgi:hypothetical protein
MVVTPNGSNYASDKSYKYEYRAYAAIWFAICNKADYTNSPVISMQYIAIGA